MSEAEAQQAPLDDVGDDSDRVTMNRRIIACITVYQPDSQDSATIVDQLFDVPQWLYL